MLIRFKIKNFLSFDDLTEFSMLKGKVKSRNERIYDNGKIKLLKFASIFGANASGKTNLVKALGYVQSKITNDSDSTNRNLYFKGKTDNSNKPSYFELEILLNDKVYSYGFEILIEKNQIVSEWLIELQDKNEEKIIFSRNLKTKEYEILKKITDKSNKERLNVYFDDVKENNSVLFLKEMNRSKENIYKKQSELSIFQDIYNWFDLKLDVSRSNKISSGYSYLLNDKISNQVIETIQSFGTGINSFEFKPIDKAELFKDMPKTWYNKFNKDLDKIIKLKAKNGLQHSDFNQNLGGYPIGGLRTNQNFNILYFNNELNICAAEMKLKHNNSVGEFVFEEESDGTQILFDLLELFFNKQDKVYVIDELDKSLHPQLTYKFVKLFLEKAKKSNTQLIVTTHESRLLDFDLLRQDEIWLVDKNKFGASVIYSLDEYNVRYDKKIDKAYLEGRYGGVPIFTTLFPLED